MELPAELSRKSQGRRWFWMRVQATPSLTQVTYRTHRYSFSYTTATCLMCGTNVWRVNDVPRVVKSHRPRLALGRQALLRVRNIATQCIYVIIDISSAVFMPDLFVQLHIQLTSTCSLSNSVCFARSAISDLFRAQGGGSKGRSPVSNLNTVTPSDHKSTASL